MTDETQRETFEDFDRGAFFEFEHDGKKVLSCRVGTGVDGHVAWRDCDFVAGAWKVGGEPEVDAALTGRKRRTARSDKHLREHEPAPRTAPPLVAHVLDDPSLDHDDGTAALSALIQTAARHAHELGIAWPEDGIQVPYGPRGRARDHEPGEPANPSLAITDESVERRKREDKRRWM